MKKMKVHTIKWDRVIYPKACPLDEHTVLAMHCILCPYEVNIRWKTSNGRGCEVDCSYPHWEKIFKENMKGIYHNIKVSL